MNKSAVDMIMNGARVKLEGLEPGCDFWVEHTDNGARNTILDVEGKYFAILPPLPDSPYTVDERGEVEIVVMPTFEIQAGKAVSKKKLKNC